MKTALRLLAVLLPVLMTPACGEGSEGSASTEGWNRDRGSASMQVAGEPWVGESARARIKGPKLSLDLVRSDTVGTVTTRGQVKLVLSDFDGPGTYTASRSSMFVVVTIDRAMLPKDTDSDESATAVLKDALGGTDTWILSGGQVVITSVTKTEVEGTFQWTPPAGSRGSDRALTDGQFRAIVR